MSEKPLYIKVGEALGCSVRDRGDRLMLCDCDGHPHGQDAPDEHGDRWPIKRYDTDWSATGPLIDKLDIDLEHVCDCVRAGRFLEVGANGLENESKYLWAEGDTALTAICNLILALHAAGKVAAVMTRREVDVVGKDEPLTYEELAGIDAEMARMAKEGSADLDPGDVLRLVSEVRRLRAALAILHASEAGGVQPSEATPSQHTWWCWCCKGQRPGCDCNIFYDSNGGADEHCAAHLKTLFDSMERKPGA